jgi:hypothetical protein
MADEAMTLWLADFLRRQGAVAGTVHVRRGELLELAAAVNIPPKVQEITRTIPHGKGMAGLAWERDRPITTCNLQEDASGQVKPGAKAVDARAAVAFPLHAGDALAVIGAAYPDERDLPDEELARIAADVDGFPWPA